MCLKQEKSNTQNSFEYVGDQYLNKQKLAAPVKVAVDKFQLIPEFLKIRRLVKQQLDSFNYFVNTGIKRIVQANNQIVSGVDASIYVRFKDVRIGQPSMVVNAIMQKLNPHACRLSNMTNIFEVPFVFGPLCICLLFHSLENDFIIGRMPIMLRSCCCELYGKDETELARLGECPLDPGGCFIIKGMEKFENDILEDSPHFVALFLRTGQWLSFVAV
ncbi:RNA polymerase [Theobroma cacao]|nr:RNA polymerase [Theobroma cacao]